MTTREKINRQRKVTVTPEILTTFEAMKALDGKCVCKPGRDEQCATCCQWWELHSKIHEMLGCRPWHWPCLPAERLDPDYDENDPGNEPFAEALRRRLDRALAASR